MASLMLWAHSFCPGFSWTYRNTARGARFSLGFGMYLILAQTDEEYLILAFAIF